MAYEDTKKYWVMKGEVYQSVFKHNKRYKLQEEMLLDYLRSLQFSTVLEIGCGFGRMTKLLLQNFSPHITDYVAMDISSHQIENAKKYLGELTAAKVKFINSDIMNLALDKKFDLVLCSEVLLHIPHDTIQQVMDKLVGWSSRNVVSIDWYEDIPTQPEMENNFLHQYEELYKLNPMVKDVKRIPIRKQNWLSKIEAKQSIFHVIVS